jgi:UDP:flavonoid glycosyltransferase YjiC (YdhE family)
MDYTSQIGPLVYEPESELDQNLVNFLEKNSNIILVSLGTLSQIDHKQLDFILDG